MNLAESTNETMVSSWLREHDLPPFIFVGSGFSQRYANLPNWRGLHEQLASELGVEINKIRGDAGQDMERIGSILRDLYWEFAWKKRRDWATANAFDDKSQPIKHRIADLFHDRGLDCGNDLRVELDHLRQANLAGVITTNYDRLLEDVFPNFEVYVGERSMLFKTLHRWGELYKIHGCCSSPATILFTSEDYEQFRGRQKYLTALLLTLFMEHPIIFVGYSLTDKNIQGILSDILDCIGNDSAMVEQLARRLLFVNRLGSGRSSGFQDAMISIEGRAIQVSALNTDDFAEVYRPLTAMKHKISAALIRRIQSSLFEIVRSSEPTDRIAVIDEKRFQDPTVEIDFVVGVGVEAKFFNRQVSRDEIFQAFLDQDVPVGILSNGIVPWLQGGANRILIPVHKFMKTEVCDDERLQKRLAKPMDEFLPGHYKMKSNGEHLTSEDYANITENDLSQHKTWVRLMTTPPKNLNDMEAFIRRWRETGRRDDWYRLVCIYDILRFKQ